MGLYGPVERRSIAAKTVYSIMYIILLVGSITMIYPFALMLGASVTSDLDLDEWRVVPAYLTDDTALFRKWMNDRYGDLFLYAARIHGLESNQFRYLDAIPHYDLERPETRRRIEDWFEFVEGLPPDSRVTLFRDPLRKTRPMYLRYAAWLSRRYESDIGKFNERFRTAYTSFAEIDPTESYITHNSKPDRGPLRVEFIEFTRTLSGTDFLVPLTGDAAANFLERQYGSLEAVNAALETNYDSLGDLAFPRQRPEPGPWRDFWDVYVVKRFPLSQTRILGDLDADWRDFLRETYEDYDDRVRAYNSENRTAFPLLSGARFPDVMPDDDLRYADWVKFVDRHVPPEARALITAEGLYQDWLGARYGSLDEVNRAYATDFQSWDETIPPRAEADVYAFTTNAPAIRWEFFTRNYKLVLSYVLINGKSLWNTFVLVLLTVLGQLTVQPLAAYGLSRFRLPYAHRILLFLLATMAFPAEVAMIPNFLMIKELGLLNTYWALVLPGLASGMGIFLLKGYFDSLPAELYEAAMMDGAGELRMFLQITIPLSQPILAVIALGAFAAAYGGFMWAFLICQRPDMWTLMVHLWQLGQKNYPSVWMAGLVVAAMPTLLVFVFCQNIILRGIIIPTMK